MVKLLTQKPDRFSDGTLWAELYEDCASITCAFPVFAQVWWTEENCRQPQRSIGSIDDAIQAFNSDSRYIVPLFADEFLQPVAQSDAAPAVEVHLRRAAELERAALDLLDKHITRVESRRDALHRNES